MGFLAENYCKVEGLNVNSSCDSSTPANGFVKGDPIKKTDYKTGRETTAVTDLIHGICIGSLVYPYTKKTLEVATKGQVEVTAAAAVSINAWVGLDGTNKRKFTPLTLDAAGTTIRQAFQAKSAAAADGDKFIIDLDSMVMVTI